MVSNYGWIVLTALISAAIAYAMLRPSPFACTAHPDADISKPASEIRLRPSRFANEARRRCHTGSMAEVPPAGIAAHRSGLEMGEVTDWRPLRKDTPGSSLARSGLPRSESRQFVTLQCNRYLSQKSESLQRERSNGDNADIRTFGIWGGKRHHRPDADVYCSELSS